MSEPTNADILMSVTSIERSFNRLLETLNKMDDKLDLILEAATKDSPGHNLYEVLERLCVKIDLNTAVLQRVDNTLAGIVEDA